jgi:hypothetical protein
MAEAKPPSGRTILKAIRDELMLNLYPMPYSTLAVSVYHVYLHPRDFEAIEPIAPRIVEQVQRALTTEVESFNARLGQKATRVLNRLLKRIDPFAPIEIPPAGWDVYILPDPDGALKPGELGIVSTLSLARAAEYEGTPTTRIVKSVVASGRRTETSSEIAKDAATPMVSAPASPVATGISRSAPITSLPDSLSDSTERARLIYEDEQGPHVFSMRKDSLSVGRGGSAAWVDVQVIANAKVSREHFRIRRDPAGRFYIQDVSSWGTSVNGEPVPPPIKSDQGVLQPGPERELPLEARIALADAMEIRFEASTPR